MTSSSTNQQSTCLTYVYMIINLYLINYVYIYNNYIWYLFLFENNLKYYVT